MRSRLSDEADYLFLTVPSAVVRIGLGTSENGPAEIQVVGNRAGLLSLANVLLWLVANAWRREFLGLGELPFVQFEASLTISIRLSVEEATNRDGLLSRTDRGEQFEWTIGEDDLKRVALHVHRLASNPGHEYVRLRLSEGSSAEVQVRMTDAADWIS